MKEAPRRPPSQTSEVFAVRAVLVEVPVVHIVRRSRGWNEHAKAV